MIEMASFPTERLEPFIQGFPAMSYASQMSGSIMQLVEDAASIRRAVKLEGVRFKLSVTVPEFPVAYRTLQLGRHEWGA